MTAGLDARPCSGKSVIGGVTRRGERGKGTRTGCRVGNRDGKVRSWGMGSTSRRGSLDNLGFEGFGVRARRYVWVREHKLIGKRADGDRSENRNRQRPVCHTGLFSDRDWVDAVGLMQATSRNSEHDGAKEVHSQSCMSCCCWSLPTLLSFSLSS